MKPKKIPTALSRDDVKKELKKVFDDELDDVKENVVEEVENLLPETPRLKSVSFSELPVEVKDGDEVTIDKKDVEDETGDIEDEESTTKETQTDVEMGISDENTDTPVNEEINFLEGIKDEDEK